MNKKGQAAMEFLMTYGWAILVVLAAIAALAYFGVLSPSKILPERTTFSAPLPNVDNAVVDATGYAEVAFRNNVGVTITIDPGQTAFLNASGSTSCTFSDLLINGDTATVTSVPNGETFILRWVCNEAGTVGEKFKLDVVGFEYTNLETGQTKKHSGSIDGKYQ